MITSDYRTALHWAAYRGHFWIVNLLVEAGFDPNALTLDQRTAIDLTSDDSVRDLLMHPHNNLRTHDRGKSGIPQLTVRKEHSGARTLHLNGGEVERDTGRRRSMEYGSPLSSASPTSKNIFHYGRRDSLNRTRYLLVKNRTEDSKDSYKRVTLPGSGIEDEENAVNNMKVTIEKAMKMGHVSEVLVLPGQVPVTSAEQIKMFGDNQKVEVVFTKPTVEVTLYIFH
ncbi:hypothetical protein AB6A40_009435 [Gnathostoma spinigerum]|uniref:Uncharacterized protein n=1 Tax=Gnathostoma spinigerum TaxID=75299 RepID=A0ABD6ETS8_9BILA